MFKSLRGRLVTIVVISALAIWQLYANQRDFGSPLKLGLDLQGGMHLVLEVDDSLGTMTPEARADGILRAEQILRTRIDEFGVEEPIIQRSGQDRLIVELAGINDPDRARGVIQQSAYLEFKLVIPPNEASAFDNTVLPRIDRTLVTTLGPDSIRSLGRAVEGPDGRAGAGAIEDLLFGGDTAGAAAAGDSAAAADSAEAAPEDDAPNLRPFSSLLFQGDIPGTYRIAEEDIPIARLLLAVPEVQRALPRNVQLHWSTDLTASGARNFRMLYILQEDAFLTGDRIDDATATRDPQFNQALVQFSLTRAGGREFSQVTGANVGAYLAIVLDGDVVSAPVIRDRIGARGQIELSGSPMEEARDLALVLRAGALPTPLRIMEERTVGPSLGADSIEQGRLAGLIGIVLVMVIMVAYYRMAGVLALGALAVYLILVLGGLAGMGATLTLPGIAGLILSVGMAVDANVLIFERIREELAAGRATRTAVDEGFGHALSAIVDANITTLITALILFQFGTGPVRGFAVTLSIGIVASFFSALYVTRTLFTLYLSRKKATDPISV